METKNKKMKVLVVEDDEASGMVMATLVKLEGHDVMKAVNGAEGLELFDFFKPDLIFSDISMPIMDGLEMLKKIRQKSTSAIVVMTSAFGTADFTLKALRLGANDYLVKPFHPHDIVTNLNKYANVLANRSVEREVVGLILHRQLTMKLGNTPEIASKVADRLMQETEGRIPPSERLGILIGLLEIIINAIEHGNLDITYDEKTTALAGGPEDWLRLVTDRMAKAPYKDRSVLIQFQMDGESCEWTITDDGNGFDWKKVPDPHNPENLMATHGRGIILTRLNFDDVSYLGKGNQVVLRKNLPRP
ncbi:MAG: response regulator [Candidatus Ozemobacteraceae bacterium]